MSAIETMMQSEYSRLYRTVTRLREECLQRPKGSLAVKKRGKGSYVYLVKRVDGKVVTEYVGKLGTWKTKGVEAKVLERRRYEAELKEAEIQIFKLKKLMKASDAFFVEPTR
ncbi:MAG TPA: hypothetical protein VN445_03705 [Rectinemataceae bacterium]|nr:hypothetical protein [Rectinemataceae bacterium]